MLAIIICVISVVGLIIVALLKKTGNHPHVNPCKSSADASAACPTAYEEALERISGINNADAVDIEAEIKSNFDGIVITANQEADIIQRFNPVYKKAHSLVKKLDIFHLTPSEAISKLIRDFGNIKKLIEQHNAHIIEKILKENQAFFDNCLNYPLDPQQRRSIISDEDNCLVISSAGSGKTSSIIGKVKYLTEIKNIDPKRILLISYTNKAAAELTERVATDGLKGYTFHKLALEIIGKTTGTKPSICDKTDALFIDAYHTLAQDEDFKNHVLDYLSGYHTDEAEWDLRKNERRHKLSEQKNARLKALVPDMDGKEIHVRSKQEQQICFILFSLGVRFRYEEIYEHLLADEVHSQYRPDFSIYFEQNGTTKRIYLEHFGIDDHGCVPAWFANDLNLSYEDANRKYSDSMAWKRAAHMKFGTTLLETCSSDFLYDSIQSKMKNLLIHAGVPLKEKNAGEIYSFILPSGSKQENTFIRLAATFIVLAKSSGKSMTEILKKAEDAHDDRSASIIRNIFIPVYNSYIKMLADRNQIDFTDAILQATDICKEHHPVTYDYIIVDEFQDISIDRYKFLKALREGIYPAKLYCVGDDWQSIYRFAGSDLALLHQFRKYFGPTEIHRIETTYRFGEPLVALSSRFIKRNPVQINKNIRSFSLDMKTDLEFCPYIRREYCATIARLIASIPAGKSIFLLGRFSFDDYYLSFMYKGVRDGNRFYYFIDGRKIEFLTVHKAKGLEADYVIILQCNNDSYGFPSLINDDRVLDYVLTESETFPFGEERRLFYVAITRARIKTFVLYDRRYPSAFVEEFLHPEKQDTTIISRHPNANKRWSKKADQFLLSLYRQGKTVKYISSKMGRSQTSIIMRLNKLNP